MYVGCLANQDRSETEKIRFHFNGKEISFLQDATVNLATTETRKPNATELRVLISYQRSSLTRNQRLLDGWGKIVHIWKLSRSICWQLFTFPPPRIGSDVTILLCLIIRGWSASSDYWFSYTSVATILDHIRCKGVTLDRAPPDLRSLPKARGMGNLTKWHPPYFLWFQIWSKISNHYNSIWRKFEKAETKTFVSN